MSVGIDIGTSTTQVIFSHITVEDMSSGFSVPRIEIVAKDIIYRGDIHFTPLLSQTEIDMARVRGMVAEEYRKAGVDKRGIKTGAVVITGETARKQNAGEVLLHLSDFAGDFVVATAGPDLESIIAARGAGADIYAKQHSTTAANYDIGGGTSNFAMFNKSQLISTSCLDIGGRLIRLDPKTKKIAYIAPKIAELCKTAGIAVQPGDPADGRILKKVADEMCALLEMSLGLRRKSAFYPRILTEEKHDVEMPAELKNICFSGGVADYIYHDRSEEDVFRFGDIGILLGRSIRASAAMAKINRFVSNETIRATVVGAGSHITEISGSTIEYDPALLPMKNIPILKLVEEEAATPEGMRQAIEKKLKWFYLEGELQTVGIAFKGPKSPGFQLVGEIAEAILSGAKSIVNAGMPLLVISENDMAKVLGQTIRAMLPNHKGFICIDAIKVDNGDYIDVGSPVAGGSVLPVVIKTLIFQ